MLALPAAIVVGFGFAGMGIGASTFLRSWQDFDSVQLVQLPMFLFSATFYPLSVYPVAIQWFVRFSPLYHAITLDPRRSRSARRPGSNLARRGATSSRSALSGSGSPARPHGRAAADVEEQEWAIVDSNHGPPPYQSGALTN